MRYKPPDPSFFIENRKKFEEKMAPQSVAVFHSRDEYPRNGDQYYAYRQQSDLLYLTGIEQEKTVLLLAPGHPEPKNRQILFIIEPNEQIAVWNGHKHTREEVKKISGVGNVQWLANFDLVLQDLLSWCESVYLNIYEYPKFFPDMMSRDQRFARQLLEKFPAHQYRRAAPIMTSLRMVKTNTEIELIRQAIDITGKAFRRILGFLRPGITEFEVQAEIEHEFLVNRASGSAYLPIIASGKNGCVLHYTTNDATCSDGDLLLMDFGAEYANYIADLSRTIPVNGRFTPRQRQVYEAVLGVQKDAILQMYPGNTMENYNKFVNSRMETEMIRLGLFTEEETRQQDPENPLYKKFFMHGTAHHIGLDVHDVMNRHELFLPGMVLTCEPGIYLPDEGFGIRIENNILITEKGPVDLTQHIPRDPDEIEALMKR